MPKIDLTIKPLDDEKEKERRAKKLDCRLPKPYFCAVVQGSPGSGKTSMVLNWIKFYAPFHDSYIFVSPTAQHDPKMKKVIMTLAKKGKHLELINKINKDTLGLVKLAIEEAPGNTFLFLDDVTGDSSILARDSDLVKFVTNRRHLKLNIMLCVHSYKATPKKMRENTNIRIFFDALRVDRKELQEETDIDLDPYMDQLNRFEFVMIQSMPRNQFKISRNMCGNFNLDNNQI